MAFVTYAIGVVCALLVLSSVEAVSVSDALLQDLFDRIGDEQFQETLPYKAFEQSYQKKGLYPTYVKQYFHGNSDEAEARFHFSLVDNNMFATEWVTAALLEAHVTAGSTRPTDKQLLMALGAFVDYHDQNQEFNSSAMSFWEQYYDADLDVYKCTPHYVMSIYQETRTLPKGLVEDLLKDMDLGFLTDYLKNSMAFEDDLTHIFNLRPDFDDTYVNVVLGATLYKNRQEFPAAWITWQEQNPNVTSAFDAVKKYAYRPFSSDADAIDPRTYYWARGFLDKAKSQGKDVTLVTTYATSINEQQEQIAKGLTMPLSMNNVGAGICANVIYGISSAVLSGLISPDVLDDSVMESLYHNTSMLIADQIQTNLTDRPDLVLVYYDSRFLFYWFVARTLDLLETAVTKGPLPRPVMTTVYKALKTAMQSDATEYILNHGESDGKGGVYFDGFLDDGADRIFTTAVAANALLYTWTTQTDTAKTFTWRADTPTAVRTMVSGCVHWLTTNVLSGEFNSSNVFSSLSLKDGPTWPQWYPANVYEYINGTAIDDWSRLPENLFSVIHAVQGYMTPQEYEAQLSQTHFGQKTPRDFQGFKYFVFWSAPSITYASSLVALSRYRAILEY